MVKCLTHGLRGFNGAVQRRLAMLTVTMLISSCWQLLSEVELRRIFDVCKRWANSGSHEFVKKNMVWYMRPRGDSLTARVKTQCTNRPFSPLVSKYTILYFVCVSGFVIYFCYGISHSAQGRKNKISLSEPVNMTTKF